MVRDPMHVGFIFPGGELSIDQLAAAAARSLVDEVNFAAVHSAFLFEGFAVPSFMHGQFITNPDAGVAVVYYDKPRSAGVFRVEVLYPLGGEPRQQPLVPGPSG